MTAQVPFEAAVASLAPEQSAIARALHEKMLALGCVCAASAMGGKPDQYKVEYRKGKPARSLLILRIDGAKCSARLKLFHLSAYTELLNGLSDEARSELLSKGCGAHKGGGCKGPVRVEYGGGKYVLCRHSMQIKAMSERDLPAALALLEAEDGFGE